MRTEAQSPKKAHEHAAWLLVKVSVRDVVAEAQGPCLLKNAEFQMLAVLLGVERSKPF
ncbi:hypothetical protein KL86DPRO_20499 [uncultured delta proteobacterium]|uniref:Uncharacterized protein n=1 Tax=uncultured delta proteobacterium TaxID=34034 RepID=A0A212K1F6_9DELT|nr:hypothetical protein KL86DPRO_20499 [uncultured delta proteobacterium]